MPNSAEMIAKLSADLAIQKVLLLIHDNEVKSLEELEQYLKAMLEPK